MRNPSTRHHSVPLVSTGFLAPFEAPEQDRSDESSGEQIDLIPKVAGLDDESAPEASSTRKTPFPSSIGLSVLVPSGCNKITATVTWGDYKPAEEKDSTNGWRRTPKWSQLDIPLTAGKPEYNLPDSDGLRLAVSARTIPEHSDMNLVPAGSRVVSIFVVNKRPAAEPAARKDMAYAFQVKLQLASDHPFVPRPNLRGLFTQDPDERIADLQYRDAMEYVVGHGTSAHAHVDADHHCKLVESIWIPRCEVERVEAARRDGVEFKMDALSILQDGAQARHALSGLVTQYRKWLDEQSIPPGAQRKEVAINLVNRGKALSSRIEAGIAALDDVQVLEAFRLANKVMATAARKRNSDRNPAWRPFQLAFLLLNINGMADPLHNDREWVDLLFFPTGGGKTEAYLGLSAFTIFLRRLRNSGVSGAGVTVIMRYTLRLLTLDQLGRAATLICAMELERQKDVEKLGTWPFEIGLWVGQAATPNEMGKKGDKHDRTARARTRQFKSDPDRYPSPIPLESCPWCGTKFTRHSFTLEPNEDYPLNLRIVCASRRCEFSGNNSLPILGVDEPIYRRLPAFLIATVDKFANLPWVGHTGKLFGKVDRADKLGFYGPCDPLSEGNKLPQPLLPPDLIIQDELHLISGPLGTMVGLYETAIDALCRRQVGDKTIRPKVVASTATVRRAEAQIRALFCRSGVEIFPCPGPNRRDSFFARTVSIKDKPGRLYLGVAAQGRSPKIIMLRTYLALMGAAEKAFVANGGAKNPNNPADPYMTLLGYFNALRELGGCRRIVEDEVYSQLLGRGTRMRVGEQTGLFANRKIKVDPTGMELTSRVNTTQVARLKEKLGKDFSQDEHVDVALATNMISVGLDISRLGLLVVFGQPKTTAEYIQATSRVGRQEDKPGLVITMMNVHKPRDRSHYERFEAYHETFYRSVEASSVTPFSPRALDRAMAEVVVALSRQGHPQFTRYDNAIRAKDDRGKLTDVIDTFGQRAASYVVTTTEISDEQRATVRNKVSDLLDDWEKVARMKHDNGATLRYQAFEAGSTGPYLLRDPLDPDMERIEKIERRFKAHRSLRDVEPAVNLWLKQLNGIEIENPEVD